MEIWIATGNKGKLEEFKLGLNYNSYNDDRPEFPDEDKEPEDPRSIYMQENVGFNPR